MNDLHRSPAKHVGRPNDHRIANFLSHPFGLFAAGGGAIRGLAKIEAAQQFLKARAVFGQVDGVGRGAEDGDLRGLQGLRQF